MIPTRPRNALLFAVLVAAFPIGGGAAADAPYRDGRILDREEWWPYATGPHYGDVAQAARHEPRVVVLPVGSFDTRSPEWDVPASLRLDESARAKPGSPWLVQMEGPITDEKKATLAEAGAKIYGFHQVNTFLVRAQDPSALASLPGVLWAGPYHPAYRIEPALGKAPTADPVKARNQRISVRVRLFEADEKGVVVERLQALGAEIDWTATHEPSDLPGRVYFTAATPTILEAARMDEVLWVEEVSTEAFPLNAETQYVVQSGSLAGGRPFWDAGVDGSTQIVSVADSGMDVDTILLSDTETDAGTPGPGHRKVQAYTPWGGGDYTTCGATGYTHGTNTSQCAVGNRSDFGLSDTFDGVARGARIVFQDIGVPGSCGLSTPSSMVGMWDEVRAHGGHMMNGSFVTCSYGTYGSTAFDLDSYGWDHRDFLAFFSGGNGGSGNACPGTNKNHISSGGHYQVPFDDEHYGSYGPAPDGRVGPTVLAPACDHAGGNPPPFDYDTSVSIQGDDNDIVGLPSGESELVEGVCGTSFSSPYLLGVGALIRDYFEKGFWPSGSANPDDTFAPSGAMVKATLINSGEYVVGCVGCVLPGFMGSMGMGRVNLSSTLTLAGNPQTPPGTRIVDLGMSNGLETGEVYEEYVEVADPAVPLKVTLVWVDRPGSTLTNDLRLVVIGPAGTPGQTYYGNNFQSGQYSVPEAAGGTVNDATNVFEAVRLKPSGVVPGVWRIRVEGTNVPLGDPNFGDTQPFALIVTGGIDSLGIGEVSSVDALPLRATSRTATEVAWEWDPLSDPTIDYSFYRGSVAAIRSGVYDHAMIDSSQCGISGGTTTVADAADGQSWYYLVAGHKNGNDGPLGEERPRADPRCP